MLGKKVLFAAFFLGLFVGYAGNGVAIPLAGLFHDVPARFHAAVYSAAKPCGIHGNRFSSFRYVGVCVFAVRVHYLHFYPAFLTTPLKKAPCSGITY